MIASDFLPIANHLWQSTLIVIVAGCLTLLLKNNRAHTRYCLWLAASVKFLIPFSLFVSVGSQFGWHVAVGPALSSVPVIIERVHEPFGSEVSLQSTPKADTPRTASVLLPVVVVLWATGSGILLISWWRKWRRLRAAIRAASPLALPIEVPALSSSSFVEPGVFGLFHPVLLLPDGIVAHLTPAEFQAILAHELCHVRRRDNLATVMHMIVESVFWFHPLVWWVGARLMEERERACDEEVLQSGSKPEAYAEGILKVCELYLASPLKCVAGVTGANLKKRIEAIMTNPSALKLSFAKRAGLVTAGVLAIAIPVMLGVVNAPTLRAQAQPDLRFEVASVRRVEIATINGRNPVYPRTGGIGTSDPRRITYRGAWLASLISEAFAVRPDQITGPKWLGMERYDIVANIPEGATKEQFNIMLGNLLRDRFHLRFRMDSKVLPVYVLRVGKNGHKLKEAVSRTGEVKTFPPGTDAQGFPILPPDFRGSISLPQRGEIFVVSQDAPIASLVSLIQGPQGAGRPVIDETGLTGHYDFKIHFEWRPRSADVGGIPSDPAPSVFTAVEAQLGLRLESANRPFDHLIIDSIDREPTEN